jgi:tyrosinase
MPSRGGSLGDMSDVTTAGYDPIFFAHHCVIDRVWYLWQVPTRKRGVPRDLCDLPLTPFGKTTRDVLDASRSRYPCCRARSFSGTPAHRYQ